ncbi:MAG: hypothetical protein N2512_01215 [Armatimonadetes bacterium]|nr:hypothetical protein [Armatimonadota bacterium]
MPGWLSAPNLAPVPLALFAWAAVFLAATALGWSLTRWLGFNGLLRSQRFLVAAGLGYVAVAYGILSIGLAGWLRPWAIAAILAAALLAGASSMRDLVDLFREDLRRLRHALTQSSARWLYRFLAVWVVLVLLGALAPSDGRDWDGLSEHLAQAKTYLRHGRVEPLWYDHHSHFPNTTVMLCCAGLAFGGQGAAKLFHWSFAVLALLAAWGLARLWVHPGSGATVGWVLASTPAIGWLATVGYVDLASVFFCLAAAEALLAWLENDDRRDLLRAGLLCGAGMTAKMQGLFTFAVFGLAVLFFTWRLRRPLVPVVFFGLVAVLLACPWYIKSYVTTGNPFYPFAYGIFGGKHWSAEQARAYAYHHASFGYGSLPPESQWQELPFLAKRFSGPRSPLSMLLAPFTLTFFPEYYDPRQPRLTAMALFSIGPMWLGLAPLVLLLPRPRPRALARLAGLFAIFWLLWLQTTQLARYLLPWLALLAPLAGHALQTRLDAGGVSRRAFGMMAAAWSLVALGFLWMQVGPALPVIAGAQSAESYLRRALDVYQALDYVNRFTPPDAKVGTYGEPRLFYLDRDYLWADPGHSQLIDYSATNTARALAGEYRRLGLTHILVNQRFFGRLDETSDKLHELLRQSLEEGLLRREAVLGRGGEFVLLQVKQDGGRTR